MFERVHETKRLGRKGQAFFSLIRAIESMRLYRLQLMTASAELVGHHYVVLMCS